MLVEKTLGHRYCSECMEGPKPCIILSVDWEQVVLCERCYTELGTLFSVGDDKLDNLPDDAPELEGKRVLRVGIDVYDGDWVFFWADGTKLILNGWQDSCSRDTGISSDERNWLDESRNDFD